ncbi:MAG: hypothetical protein AAF561_08535 [Planctomycetota bacterium]
MSTVAEIEEAIQALPRDEQRGLLNRLDERLRHPRHGTAEEFADWLMSKSPDDPELTPKERLVRQIAGQGKYKGTFEEIAEYTRSDVY